MEILNTKKSFRREFKRQLRYAIAAAVGFIIAFSWRETIISATRDIVERLTEAAGNIVNVYNSLFITLIGVIIIILSSKILED